MSRSKEINLKHSSISCTSTIVSVLYTSSPSFFPILVHLTRKKQINHFWSIVHMERKYSLSIAPNLQFVNTQLITLEVFILHTSTGVNIRPDDCYDFQRMDLRSCCVKSKLFCEKSSDLYAILQKKVNNCQPASTKFCLH